MAAPFDVASLELTGEAVRVLENIRLGTVGAAHLALSHTGELIYRATGGRRLVEPVWVDRSGVVTTIDSTLRWPYQSVYAGVTLSLDGSRLAFRMQGDESSDIWVKDLTLGSLSQVTARGSMDYRPEWAPGGQSITFMSGRAGTLGLFRKRADGVGADTALVLLERNLDEGVISPDGNWVVYRVGSAGGRDIYAQPMDAAAEPVPMIVTEFEEYAPVFSPDSRWLAYVSDASGRPEVYVRSFPRGDVVTQVSSSTGFEPRWARSGRELFYRNGSGDLVAVAVTTDPTFTISRQEVLFSASEFQTDPFHTSYDVSVDDQRFVMLRPVGDGGGELIWIENFFEELNDKVGN